MQKQNRFITEESLTKLKEEETKRAETQAAFQKQINDIVSMIKESKDSNEKLQEDKAKMSEHFKQLVEQMQTKQKEIESMDQKMCLELKLKDAKLTKAQMEAAMEKEQMLKERHDMLVELKTCRQELNELQAREQLLQDQLSIYTEKYQDFHASVTKSNEIFVTYKKEMEKMSKTILKLEKESLTWKIKFEKSNVALLDMAAEKQMRDQILHKTTRQFIQLQKLCRTFQSERLVLIAALNENHIEIPAMPEVPDEAPVLPELPPLPPRDDTRINALSKNCAELKQNLAALQSQALQISEDAKNGAGDSAVAESPKKGKAKSKKKNAKKVSDAEIAQPLENGSTEVVEEVKGDVAVPETTTTTSTPSEEDLPSIAKEQEADKTSSPPPFAEPPTTTTTTTPTEVTVPE